MICQVAQYQDWSAISPDKITVTAVKSIMKSMDQASIADYNSRYFFKRNVDASTIVTMYLGRLVLLKIISGGL